MLRKLFPICIATLVIVAACSSRPVSQTDTASTSSPKSKVSQSSETLGSDNVVSTETTEGGTLVRLWADPPTLDPHLSTDTTSATIIVEVFGGLVTIDQDLKIVGDLAETWEKSPNNMSYTFYLRKDAKFHDGKSVTAHDVKWSLERATDPQTRSPVVDQYLGDIIGVRDKLEGKVTELKGVQVLDDHTLKIDIDAPKSYFLAKLTYPTGFVLDREQVESDPRWFRHPNATGPFRLAEYELGVRLVLERNDFYHLGPPKLSQVRFILSGGTGMLMYENDEIQITGVGLGDLDRILDPSSSLHSQLKRAPPTFSTQYIGMNVNEPPFDDPKVRLALNYAINREEIANIVLGDLVVPSKGIIPPDFPGYDPTIEGYKYDPARAVQLLAESKYGGPENLPLIILTSPGSFGANVGLDTQVIQEMWRQNLGIEVEVQQTDFVVYLQDLNRRLFQMFEIGWVADYPDPENFLDILFHSQSTNNHTGYSNPEVDEMLERARVGTEEARFALYHQIERMILKDAPWIPLWNSGEQFVLVKPNVRNYYLSPLIIPRLRYVYLSE